MARQHNTCFITHWGRYYIHPKKVNADWKATFTCGQCHSFAVAIHALTGWALYAIGGYGDSPDHIVVRDPERGFFDVKGFGAEVGWRGIPRPISIDEIQHYHGYLPCEPLRALPFARTILKRWTGKTFRLTRAARLIMLSTIPNTTQDKRASL
jgi:hypothetical protein